MIDSKLTFRVQEIEDGQSQRSIFLEPEDLDFDNVEEVEFERAELDISFEKRLQFIDVRFRVKALMALVCDRSLRPFSTTVEGEYEVVFKPVVEEESEGEASRVKQIDHRDLTISIEQEVRDTILLELPVKKLHPDFLDQEGRPVDFETQRYGGDDEEADTIDPRWEALKKLKREL